MRGTEVSNAMLDGGPEVTQYGSLPPMVFEASREVSRRLASHPHAAVARYPGKTVADVVAHLWSVQDWVERVLSSRATQRLSRRAWEEGAGDLRVTFDRTTDSLVSALECIDPRDTVWASSGDNLAGFWFWRMLHEAEIHRWDVTSAVAGSPQVITREVAISGLDEGLRIHGELPLRGTEVDRTGAVVVLSCSDAPNRWTVDLLGDGIRVRSEAQQSTIPAWAGEITGTGSELWLWATGRLPMSAVRVNGNGLAARSLESALRSVPEAL
ncbi:maleylpyruvate isomerase N-terminal domain-containing protein [Actinomycetota bacterium]